MNAEGNTCDGAQQNQTSGPSAQRRLISLGIHPVSLVFAVPFWVAHD